MGLAGYPAQVSPAGTSVQYGGAGGDTGALADRDVILDADTAAELDALADLH